MKKFALLGLIVLVVGVFGTMFNWNEIKSQNRGEIIERSERIDPDQINAIELKSDIGSVNFFQTDGDSIEVEFIGGARKQNGDVFTIEERDGSLRIAIDHDYKWINLSIFPSWTKRESVIDVGLPSSFTGSIQASVDVGYIQVDELSVDQFTGYVNVGQITGRSLLVNQGSADVDVGEIDLSGVTGEWYLESAVGEINLQHLDWQGKIEAHTEIGNITIRIAEEPEHYSLYLDTSLGSVKGVEHSISKSGSAEDVPILEATSDIGDIRLEWGR